ncbi:conserved Plasmodium protein, unknown function [Plasmodium relictum]|uniref:General stress protein FMN-binding split barrel domain-containing protein n=1 Tax=Plasmodium relictum TaxID=85471 RepID=A0A1J1HBU5_PLARL|nr:conserved Plasmodium protein, unknown function [Plasmodium relictum]CRH02883.1 conserved Plasmodium protein, unknown function [Plasmodium relictum]
MNNLYRRFFFRSNILNKNILYRRDVIINNNYIYVRKRSFFFKTQKSNIIKNEIDEILKNENAIFLDEQKGSLNLKDEEEEEKKKEEERKKKFIHKKGKFKRLIIFISFQSVPIIGLMYLFKYLEDVKLSELNYSFNSSEDIINETIELINGSSKCFCIYLNKNQINTFYIEPLSPEESEINYEIKLERENNYFDKENQNNVTDKDQKENDKNNFSENTLRKKNRLLNEKNEENIKKLLYSLNKPIMQKVMGSKSSMGLPLNYLYFSISKNSDIHNFLKTKKSDITLLYSDDKKNVYATLSGNASIIENEEIKNIMWSDKWSYIIPDEYKENYILVKFTPSIVSLKTIGLKDDHWKSNIVKRSIINDNMSWVKI